MTTSEPHEQPPTPPPASSPPPEPGLDETRPLLIDSVEPVAVEPEVVSPPPAAAPAAVVPPMIARVEPETVFVPLAVSIGDGFKFGCGFFLALVMAMLIGFLLLAVLFVLSSLVGLNLPITR